MFGNYGVFKLASHYAQHAAQALIVLIAITLVAACAAARLNLIAWPDIALSYNGTPLPKAGMWAQIALTILFLLLCFYLPANARMARLERSHRSFQLGMEDVARAYRMAHAADRAGVFALSAEFDAMRARMDHLRTHPDLAHLEPELLQTASQMSYETRDLARAYSDERVNRAKMFLKQRQEEVQSLTDRLSTARRVCDDLRRWSSDVDADERTAQVQLRRLEADLREILPTLGFEMDDRQDANVVALPKPSK